MSGGVGGLDAGTRLIADQPNGFGNWYVEWENDGTVDTLTPTARCVHFSFP
ncbi:MAG: hypothetical protein ACR2G3_03915 [Solirubrobacterales bacterium]